MLPGPAEVRFCRDCWISCRVLDRGVMATSLDRSWSLSECPGKDAVHLLNSLGKHSYHVKMI